VIGLKSLLCPVDRSETSRRALRYATAIAGRLGAQLNVLEVIEPAVAASADEASITPALQSRTRAELEEFVASARAAGLAVTTSVETGEVVAAILARAGAISADLIVIGTHGRSGFERLALGSVAE
jgi:universal stress protein A